MEFLKATFFIVNNAAFLDLFLDPARRLFSTEIVGKKNPKKKTKYDLWGSATGPKRRPEVLFLEVFSNGPMKPGVLFGGWIMMFQHKTDTDTRDLGFYLEGGG